LFFSAGEFGGETVFFASELHKVKDFGHFVFDVGGGFAFEAEFYVLTHGEVGEESVALENSGNVALIGWEVGYVLAFQQDGAGGGDFKACDHAERGGFAAAGGANQGVEFAGGETQVDVVYGAVCGKYFRYAGEGEDVSHCIES
jgi:hypothetical protein